MVPLTLKGFVEKNGSSLTIIYLIMRLNVLTILNFNEMDVTFMNAGTSRLVLSGFGCFASGWWR